MSRICLLLQLSLVFLTIQDNLIAAAPNGTCTDFAPVGRTCEQIRDLNFCSYLPSQYCIATCQNCCYDYPHPPSTFCSEFKQYGLCEYAVQQNLCLKTCFGCDMQRTYFALEMFKNSIRDPTQLSTWNGSGLCENYRGVSCEGQEVVSIKLNGIVSKVEASIPEQFRMLSKLKTLYLYNIGLTGTIPASMFALTNLTDLRLWANSLKGPIPPALSTLTNLENLNLRSNSLKGSIPSSLSTLTNLKYLYLDQNALTGSIPSSLSTLTNLERLHLDVNSLTGSIPPTISTLSNLRYLYLYNNKLTGSIPQTFYNLFNVPNGNICTGNNVCVLSWFKTSNLFKNCNVC